MLRAGTRSRLATRCSPASAGAAATSATVVPGARRTMSSPATRGSGPWARAAGTARRRRAAIRPLRMRMARDTTCRGLVGWWGARPGSRRPLEYDPLRERASAPADEGRRRVRGGAPAEEGAGGRELSPLAGGGGGEAEHGAARRVHRRSPPRRPDRGGGEAGRRGVTGGRPARDLVAPLPAVMPNVM